MASDSLRLGTQAVRRGEGTRMRPQLISCYDAIRHGADNIVPFYAVLSGPQGSGKSLVVRQVFEVLSRKTMMQCCLPVIVVPLTRQHLTLSSALKHIRQRLCRDLMSGCTGKETQADDHRSIISLAKCTGEKMAALFFEVDEIDLFLQDTHGRQVVDFLTDLACLASANIKVGVIGMTCSNLQQLDKRSSFLYQGYEMPIMARENDAQGYAAHMQMLSSMLTTPSTLPGSADYNQQISELLQHLAVTQALQAIVKNRDAAPFPGELAHACELMLAEGCTPSLRGVLGCLDAMFPVDLIVRHLRGKSSGELLVLLAVWHATGGCAESVSYDVVCKFHDRIVRQVLGHARSEAAWKATRERKELFCKELLGEKAVRKAYETLLEEGFIYYAQARYEQNKSCLAKAGLVLRDVTLVSPWCQSVNLNLKKEYLFEALQYVPDMLGVDEIWSKRLAFEKIHLRK